MRKAFIKELIQLAQNDSNVMLITGDLGFSVFEEYQQRFPGQYFNAGLCEQSMIGIAAGMALEGKKVFVYSIIPFLTFRALEQIRNDLCYQRLPVKLVGVGSGLVYGGLGGTHHGIEDVAVMSSLPEMNVFSPGDPKEVTELIRQSMTLEGPGYIRLNRAGDPVVHHEGIKGRFKMGEPLEVKANGNDIVLFAVGNMLPVAGEVYDHLIEDGQRVRLLSVHTLNPVDTKAVLKIIRDSGLVVVLEELVANNGFSSRLSKILVEAEQQQSCLFINLPNQFTHKVGSQKYLREVYGLTREKILQKIQIQLANPENLVHV